MDLRYVLVIGDVDGGTTYSLAPGAFDIDDFTFDIGAVLASATTSRPEIEVALALTSAMPELAAFAARGTDIGPIQILGFSSPADGSQVMYDLRLGEVRITKLSEALGLTDSIALSYGHIDLTTRDMSADGTPGEPTTFRWNVQLNTIGDAIDAPTAAQDGAGPITAGRYHLVIDGIGGDGGGSPLPGSMSIDGFSFDITRPDTSDGRGTSNASFSPLEIDLSLGSAMTDLALAAAHGQTFTSIQIQGVSDRSGQSDVVYDLRIGNASIQTLEENADGSDRLSFVYETVEITTRPRQSDGTLGTPETFTWDLTRGEAGDGVAEPTPADDPQGSIRAERFVLLIDGIKGNTLDQRASDGLAVTDFSFDIEHLSGLVGTGRDNRAADLSPLEIDLVLDAALTQLATAAALGTTFEAVQIKGLSNMRSGGQVVYDLRLGNATISKLSDSRTGTDQIAFDYEQIDLTVYQQNQDGSLTPSSSFLWNTKLNAAGSPVREPLPVIEGVETEDQWPILLVIAEDDPEVISGADAALVITGTAGTLNGDTIEDFGREDELRVTGGTDSSFDRATGTLSLITEDGTAPATLTVEVGTTDGLLSYTRAGDTVFVRARDLPALADRQEVSQADVNGIFSQDFLRGRGVEFNVTLQDMGFAGYDNALGVYEIDAEGRIIDVRILFDSTKADKTASVLLSGIEDGHDIGFFLIQDGADFATALTGAEALSFTDATGDQADVLSDTFILSIDGATQQDLTIFHSYSATMNPDAIQHVLSGLGADEHSMLIGFEDLLGGGDRDFEDVVFDVAPLDYV